MTVIRPDDGYIALAEAVIGKAIEDLGTEQKDRKNRRDRYTASLFFLSEASKDFWLGLAPHMVRDFEKAQEEAESVFKEEINNPCFRDNDD